MRWVCALLLLLLLLLRSLANSQRHALLVDAENGRLRGLLDLRVGDIRLDKDAEVQRLAVHTGSRLPRG